MKQGVSFLEIQGCVDFQASFDEDFKEIQVSFLDREGGGGRKGSVIRWPFVLSFLRTSALDFWLQNVGSDPREPICGSEKIESSLATIVIRHNNAGAIACLAFVQGK